MAEKKNTVGVITFHMAENSGALLQCVALQSALEKLGFQPFVINYVPSYIKDEYRIMVNPFKETKKRNLSLGNGKLYVKSFIAFCAHNLDAPTKIRRKKFFKDYRDRYLNLSKLYGDYNEMITDPPKADIYISGSDQLWNKNLTGNLFDPAYFLNFGHERIKRYTYAVSIGKKYDLEYLKEVNSAVGTRLAVLSFREKSLCEDYAKRYTSTPCIASIDPVFLLSASEWRNYMSPAVSRNKYILVYALEKNSLFDAAVDEVFKRYPKLEIINISQCNLKLKHKNKRMLSFSPGDFLRLILDAEYIITNSFHCTSFSIILNKPFLTIAHLKGNSRLRDMLAGFGLEGRIYSGDGDALADIDYSDCNHIIKEERGFAIEYLKSMKN